MKICMMAFGVFDYSVALINALSEYCPIDFYYSKYHIQKRDSSILDLLRHKHNVNLIGYGRYRIRDIRNIPLYYRLCKDIKKRRYDVVHFQEYGTPWIALVWRICRQYPLVMTVHDPYQHPGLPFTQNIYQGVMQKICIGKADKIIVHGVILKKQFLERYSEKKNEDVIVLPHGDFSIMKYWHEDKNSNMEPNSEKNILFFGTIRPNKGLEYLIKAESLVRKTMSDYRIVIAGKCNDFSRYKKYIKKGARISVVNEYIPNEDVPKYFKDASVVILPYISATQTGIIPLAYSFGKPVIATNVGAIPEVVEDGKTGLLIEPRDEKALANAIVKLISDDDLLKEMGKNALQYCEKNLSWDSIAKKTMKIYSDLIKK